MITSVKAFEILTLNIQTLMISGTIGAIATGEVVATVHNYVCMGHLFFSKHHHKVNFIAVLSGFTFLVY